MDEIIVEGVRCFHNIQSVPLKPLTLLLGENSSGKSTFLALARLAWAVSVGDADIDFNEDPFHLGAYDQIATYKQGRSGRAKSFSIGSKFRTKLGLNGESVKDGSDISILGSFGNHDAQPFLKEWTLQAGELSVQLKFPEDGNELNIKIQTGTGAIYIKDEDLFDSKMPVRQVLSFFRFYLGNEKFRNDYATEGEISESDLRLIQNLGFEVLNALGSRPYAFAPIRTHPQRTYDPIKDTPRPEGTHVPMILAKMAASDVSAWERMREILDEFGKASGLFDDVEVRRMGQKESDPFQLRVKISGPAFNLVDVGYGVSQVLPIIVDSLREEEGSTFLLQQPEVHLHPKAQAQLGSFLGLLAKQQNKRFLVETHSDYLVDRIRMDIRDHEYLTPDDVSILYFERQNGGIKIHSLLLDDFGNIVNAPPHYRQFFLNEETRFLIGQ